MTLDMNTNRRQKNLTQRVEDTLRAWSYCCSHSQRSFRDPRKEEAHCPATLDGTSCPSQRLFDSWLLRNVPCHDGPAKGQGRRSWSVCLIWAFPERNEGIPWASSSDCSLYFCVAFSMVPPKENDQLPMNNAPAFAEASARGGQVDRQVIKVCYAHSKEKDHNSCSASGGIWLCVMPPANARQRKEPKLLLRLRRYLSSCCAAARPPNQAQNVWGKNPQNQAWKMSKNWWNPEAKNQRLLHSIHPGIPQYRAVSSQ